MIVCSVLPSRVQQQSAADRALMAASDDYRAYDPRNQIDMEEAPARAPHTGSPHRALICGTLAVMAVLQVASSVAILLHLTGYLREVDLAAPQQSRNEEMHSETLIGDPIKACKEKKERCRREKRETPSAHLPIRRTSFSSKDRNNLTRIPWEDARGENLKKMTYRNERLLVEQPGYYYVYAKTCFRYIEEHESAKEDVSELQLFQYIYHEKHTQSVIEPLVLAQSVETFQWHIMKVNMHCMEQARGVRLGKNDSIFVSVSNAWLLDQDEYKTYFGSFKISD